MSGIQINDAPVLRERTDVRTRRLINKCNQSHKIADYEELSSTPQTSLLAEARLSQTPRLRRGRRLRTCADAVRLTVAAAAGLPERALF